MMNQLAADIHDWAISKGFYERSICNPSIELEKLLLAVSEITEAQAALRDGDKEHEAEEIADAFIRLLDYAAFRGIDIETEIEKKMETNQMRPYLHGKKVF